MTTVTYKRCKDIISVDISGHAGQAEAGKDIVCSAVSILAFTLRSAFITSIGDNTADRYEEKYRNGQIYLSMRVKNELAAERAAAILKGYELLEENYPKNVQIFFQNGE